LALTGCAAPALQHSPLAPAMATRTTPDRERKRHEDLIYVATGDNIYALSYSSGKLRFDLGISGYGLCADAKGDVFVTRGYDGIREYNHEGKLIGTIAETDIALSCAVDPTTGDLAVPYDASGENYVIVYSPALTRINAYGDGGVALWGLTTYDAAGNLFVDGLSGGNILAELKKGSSAFVNYTPGKPFDKLDSLQSYGKLLAIPNPSTEAIYQVKIFDQIVEIRKASYLKGWHSAYSDRTGVQTWLEDGTFIAQYGQGAQLGLWAYPQGGAATKVLGPFLSGNVNIYGIVVSRASKR
jgi:hypothetical protein